MAEDELPFVRVPSFDAFADEIQEAVNRMEPGEDLFLPWPGKVWDENEMLAYTGLEG